MAESNRNESIPRAQYEVRIDKEKLATLKDIPPGMLEWLARLPEVIRFDSQITIIVGENGAGKSTLAKAILRARGVSLKEKHPDSKNYSLLKGADDLSNVLSKVLTLEEERPDPNFKAVLLDGTRVMTEVKKWAESQSYEVASYKVENVSDGAFTHRLSSRQLFDQATQELQTQEFNRRLVTNLDIVYDEPEQGLSPQRQLELPHMLEGIIEDGDTMLVPTINLALYLSDLARIDLDKPERGVHRPSDYGESSKIEFHKSKIPE